MSFLSTPSMSVEDKELAEEDEEDEDEDAALAERC